MADIEHDLPQVAEPPLRTAGLYTIFESLARIDRKIYPHRRRDVEEETWEWDDEEGGIHLRIEHIESWTGEIQTLTVSLTQPPHIPSQESRQLIVNRVHTKGARIEDLRTTERVELREVAADGQQVYRDATDDDITEFETICLFMEAILLAQERKSRVQLKLAHAVPLSEMMGTLETSEETLFKATDF